MNSHIRLHKKIGENFSSFEEFWTFIQIFFLIVLLPVIMKLFTIPRLIKIFTPRNIRDYHGRDLEKRTCKLVKYTDYLLRNFFKCDNSCLRRSLILYFFLNKSGINVQLCFGVRNKANLSDEDMINKLEGHAWLLHKGEIFLEKNVEEAKSYKRTYCFPEIKSKFEKESSEPMLSVWDPVN